jgi:tripeptidyl-peptidase I
LRPTPEATEAVLQWLESSGIRPEEIEDDGEWINFIASVSQAEEMLDTTFGVYQSTIREGVQKIRTLHYSVPENLHQYIEMIQPTTRFGQIRPQRHQVLTKETLGEAGTALNVTGCNATITPTCLKDLYNIGNFKATGKRGSLLGVNGFLNEYARYADLAQFEKEYAPWAVGANFTWTSVKGKLQCLAI